MLEGLGESGVVFASFPRAQRGLGGLGGLPPHEESADQARPREDLLAPAAAPTRSKAQTPLDIHPLHPLHTSCSTPHLSSRLIPHTRNLHHSNSKPAKISSQTHAQQPPSRRIVLFYLFSAPPPLILTNRKITEKPLRTEETPHPGPPGEIRKNKCRTDF